MLNGGGGEGMLKLEYAQFLLICFEVYLQGIRGDSVFCIGMDGNQVCFHSCHWPHCVSHECHVFKVSYKSFPTTFFIDYK